MVGKENGTFYVNLKKIAQEIENHKIGKLGLSCIVVDNHFRARNEGDDGYCLIITQPVSGKRLSGEQFEELSKKALDFCEQKIRAEGFLFGIGPILTVESLKSWFAFLDKQKKHPILCGLPYGTTDFFLSEVVYGKKLHAEIIHAFEYRYGKNFIQKCRLVWKKEEERRQKILNDSNRGII